jgi:hypothetical protein
MTQSSCSLWITIARTDLPFMMQTIPHLVKMSHFDFEERPLSGPPTKDGTLYQSQPYAKNPDGFYEFKFFGSRVYLIKNCS